MGGWMIFGLIVGQVAALAWALSIEVRLRRGRLPKVRVGECRSLEDRISDLLRRPD